MKDIKQNAKADFSEEEHLSPILENYLKIIFHEEFEVGLARTGLIAEKANVSSSTVTAALKALKKLGYITYSPYKYIKLTEKGTQLARAITHKHIVFNEFFTSILCLDKEKSNELACDLEHVFDNETFTKFSKFVFYLMNNPAFIENWHDKANAPVVKHKSRSQKTLKTKNEKIDCNDTGEACKEEKPTPKKGRSASKKTETSIE